MEKIRNVKGMVGNGEKTHHGWSEPQDTIISCYVPTEDAKEARELKTATKNIPRPGKGTEDDGQKGKQGINRKS